MKARGKIIHLNEEAALASRSKPKARKRVVQAGQREPTFGELEQIVRDLLREEWAELRHEENRTLQREAIKNVFEEALYIWQIGDASCYRHRTVFDELADLHEKFKESAALRQGQDILALNAHKYLELSERQFRRAVWKKFVAPRLDGQRFNPFLPLPISLLDDIKASMQEAFRSKARARKARSRRARSLHKRKV
jgi:hypothetical protein